MNRPVTEAQDVPREHVADEHVADEHVPDEHVPDEHVADEHEVTSLRALFRHRRLSIATMDRPLRAATGLALAGTVAAAVLVALRDVRAPDVVLGRAEGNVVVAMSQPLFVATLVLLSVGFGYLLSAATLASRPVTLLSLVLITGAIGVEAGAFGRFLGGDGFTGLLPGWARWTTRGLLAAIWLIAALSWRVRMHLPERQAGARLHVFLLAAYSAVVGGYFVILWTAAPRSGRLDLFPEVVGLVMLDIVLVVQPVLAVAAVDFGEWGGLLGERLVGGLTGRRARLLAPAAIVLSAGLALYGYLHVAAGHGAFSAGGLARVGQDVLLVAAALALVLLVGRAVHVHRRQWPTALNFAVIFAAAALGFYVLAPIAGVFVHAPEAKAPAPIEEGRFSATADVLSTTGGHGADAFTVLIPRGWLRVKLPGADGWKDYAVPGAVPGQPRPPSARVFVTTLPAAVSAQAVATGSHLDAIARQHQDGPWTRIAFRAGPDTTGLLWARPNPAAPPQTFVLEELAIRVPAARMDPELEAVAHSFRAATEHPATLAPVREAASAAATRAYHDRLTGLTTALTAGVLAALLVGLAVAGRRWPRSVVAAVLVLGVTLVATVLYLGDQLARAAFGPHAHWPHVSLSGILAGIGIVALGAMAMFRRSPRRRALLTGIVALDTTVWALQGMNVLYDHALRASRVSVWAALTVLVAVAWDVTMSGESLTNNESKHFPRATRLLGFLGYVLLVAATILFYTAQRGAVDGQPTEALFEPEAVTQGGLFRIALPVAVLLMLLRLAGHRRAGRGSAADTVPDGEPALPASPARSVE